ncbi:MAG: MFS transporter [Xanthomonadales bacterium]|nr:MFS transporter [Xanthomonadales bacterium]NNK50034.1 MFS transporter [Xanthomonadales bacterium]
MKSEYGEFLYEKLTDDQDGRLCEDISEDACRETPRSFTLILLSSFLTKLGDALASPKTTLAWLCTALGAPPFVLGFLVPIRESGSMIPQLFIGSVVRKMPVRKWVWVAGSIGQFLCIAAIGAVAFLLDGATAGWAILALISLFSLARGFSSVAAKDVLGKTVPKSKRGQLNGWSASAAGLVSVGVGIILVVSAAASLDVTVLGILLLAAGSLWLLATLLYSQVPEYAGATGGGRNAIESMKKLKILITDRPFRRFVATRALLMCSALSAPFYVALAQNNLGSPGYLLGAFVIAAGLADLVSAPVWGRFADRSSRQVMIAAALVTSGIGLLTFAVSFMFPAVGRSIWFLPLAYFILSVAHSGVRVGRKTYVINLASGNQRTDYVAISNSSIGIMLLLAGTVGMLAPIISQAGVIGLLALMGLAGAVSGTRLPEVDKS